MKNHNKDVLTVVSELLKIRSEEHEGKIDIFEASYLMQKKVQHFASYLPEAIVKEGLDDYKRKDEEILEHAIDSSVVPGLIKFFLSDALPSDCRTAIDNALRFTDSRLSMRPYFFKKVDELLMAEEVRKVPGLKLRIEALLMTDRVVTEALLDVWSGDVSADEVAIKSAKWLTYFERNYPPEYKEYFKKCSDFQGELIGAQTKAVRERLAEADKVPKTVPGLKIKSSDIQKLNSIENSLEKWVEAANNGKTALTKNEATRAHKWLEALKAGKTIMITDRSQDLPDAFLEGVHKVAQTYVVRHNWADALGESIRAVAKADRPVDVMLPYDVCFFEFYMAGRCVILTAFQEGCEIIGSDKKKYQNPPSYIVAIECEDDYWFHEALKPSALENTPFLKAIRSQVEGICVALEAKIAVSEKVEPAAKLNKKRIANGKPPLMSYNVIDLAVRKNRGAHSSSKEYQGIVKCHLRAGHWRHLDDVRKIRIGWMLVGNPDLGFVSKHYLV